MAPDAAHKPEREAALDRIKAVLGDKGWSTDADVVAPYERDFRGLFPGNCALLARPAETGEVAEVVRLAAAAGIPVVPQGGNTGLTGAGVPDDSGEQLVLSLDRMTRVREIDPLNYTITVDAGCILADIQETAADADRLFPLSLGAEGSCRIGGNLSTNAGGVNVLRYGNARDLVLGLEVVLPDGRVWDGLRRLRKDNTGYDLKQLFIGGEGTLGVITGAVLKLFPKPRDVRTCFAAIRDLAAVTELLARARSVSGDAVTSFEYMPRLLLDFDLTHLEGVADPIEGRHDHYALIEFSGARAESGMAAAMEDLLGRAFEDGLILDAAVAQSEAQRAAFWRIRDEIVEAQKREGARIAHDISVSVSDVPAFIEAADTALERVLPGIRMLGFGHAGDGNIHYNAFRPENMPDETFLGFRDEITETVYETVRSFGGSISAEHGIGQLRRDAMIQYKSETEVAMMRRLKAALDPDGIMNPGKVL